MPKYMLHISLFFLLLTASTGVWMRLYTVSNSVHIIPYDHLLHGHSHAAILGWTFLAMLIIFFKLSWDELDNMQQEAKLLILSTGILTFIMFIAFLVEGYALYSIILSTVHILIEYWAIIFILRFLKKKPSIPFASRLFMKGAFLTLFISSLGPWSLGVIASQQLQKSALFDMAIYFYLHFQYNGWLTLMLIGMFIYALSKKGIQIQKNIVIYSFWIYTISLFPGYFLSILWYDFGKIGIILGMIGAFGQLISVMLLCYTFFKNRITIQFHFSNRNHSLLKIVFILFFCKSILELFLLYSPLANLIYETRNLVIGYLHLVLLGFITLFIFALYQMETLIDDTKLFVNVGILIFLIGFGINEIILFLSGLSQLILDKPILFQNHLLTIASGLLTFGILFIWCSLFTRQKKIVSTTNKNP